MLVGDVAEREVHAARAEAVDARRQLELELVVDALHAVQEIVLPPRTAEDLQRVVLEPLRAHRRRVGGGAAAHELKPRALAERQRRDRTGLEVAMFADARCIDRLAASVRLP